MSDYSELKRVAEAVLAMNYPWEHTVRDGRLGKTSTEYARLAHPSNVLALIAEIEQGEMHLRAFGSVAETAIAERDQLKAENAGLKTGYEAYEQVNAELKAEVEGLRAQHGRDSAELRSLSQARDDARKERDQLKADNEELRKDAERYRWLRQYTVKSLAVSGALASLDRDIDAAMTKGAKP